jgi:lipid A 3-O-deacylase
LRTFMNADSRDQRAPTRPPRNITARPGPFHRSASIRGILRLGSAALLATAATSVFAESQSAFESPHDPAFFLQGGSGDGAAKSVGLGAAFQFTRSDSPSHWAVYGEGVLGEWFAIHRDPGAGQRRSFTQVTLAPVVRYSFGEARLVFLEVGAGASIITPHYHDRERTFSTTFNFDDHAALGFRFGERAANELSVRVEHFSNAGIRNPNPGIDFAQIRFARHF